MNIDPETEVIPLLGSKRGHLSPGRHFWDQEIGALVPDPGYISYTRGALFPAPMFSLSRSEQKMDTCLSSERSRMNLEDDEAALAELP